MESLSNPSRAKRTRDVQLGMPDQIRMRLWTNDRLHDYWLTVGLHRFGGSMFALACASAVIRRSITTTLSAFAPTFNIVGFGQPETRQLMEFVHTGGVDVSVDAIIPLFKLAHYLQVEALMKAIINFWGDHIDEENVDSFIDFALEYHLSLFKEKIERFMYKENQIGFWLGTIDNAKHALRILRLGLMEKAKHIRATQEVTNINLFFEAIGQSELTKVQELCIDDSKLDDVDVTALAKAFARRAMASLKVCSYACVLEPDS